ncbi:MAG: DUF1847 domain-containing protein [Cyanobacteriota bacterium]
MEKIPECASCKVKKCRKGHDCYNINDQVNIIYNDEEIISLHKASTAIEGRHYCTANRLYETILFAKELNFKKIGLAFCIGLSSEAKEIESILSKHFEVASVCCKTCGINKKEYQLEQIKDDREEYMCNPAAQALLLNEVQTELNIACGLCVGHDSIFYKLSDAPVTTLIVKDRVLAHNPTGAIYSQYIKRDL